MKPELHVIDREDDPERCLGYMMPFSDKGHQGQCNLKRVPNSKYCIYHGGHMEVINEKKREIRNYRLRRYEQRVGELARSHGLKSLHEEIAILRVTLEELINSCDNDNLLLLYSDRIASLVGQITNTVKTCVLLEEKVGLVLDRNQTLVVADKLLQIFDRHISDPITLESIATEIVDVFIDPLKQITANVG